MSQIAPGRAPVLRPSPPYHRRMEPSPPPRPPEQSAPCNAPTPPPWPPRQAPPPRRGLYVIVFAAILAAGALIAGAILIAGSGGHESSTTAASQSAPTASATSTSQATCISWRAIRQAVVAIPNMPAGWDWNTPNIDRAIENRTGAITRALDLFEPKITSDPADVATAAHTYVAARRTEVQHLLDRTYNDADVVTSDTALAELDQLCGTGTGTEPR